uniref:Smr domain-containing protein n=1 Tax=Kalanchoe fedtschenkoi TaxID=63787 RepID=A0A7N0UWI1_KALFE
MASAAFLDVHFTFPTSSSNPKNRTPLFPSHLKPPPGKRFFIIASNSSKSTPSNSASTETLEYPNSSTPSLSDQLKPLSATILPETAGKDDNLLQTQLLSKPKSIWVNPTKAKRSVLSLQRQKRSSYAYNPQIRDLKQFAMRLNECQAEAGLMKALFGESPHEMSRENALLLLNSLKHWNKVVLFFDWIKEEKLFEVDTIFYNVVMKSLRFGRQFDLIEELANEMVSNGVELDNITYSTIITCAKRCNLFDKALHWFERMYKTGVMPDEVTYSAVLDVYAKLGKVEEVLSLYERGRANGWKPDPIAFSVLGKMFGEAGDYDGIRYVLQEMKVLDVKPNVIVYNTLLEAMGKARKPGLARALFEEMVAEGLTPDVKTLTALVKIYGKARWSRDALELWERMRANKWPMDFILYNTLLSMCADIGLEEEAEKLFDDMKRSRQCRPDSWSYAAMLNIYGSGLKADKAMAMFEEMSKKGVQLNVMGCTCLIQCLGKTKRIDDLVRVFDLSLKKGIKPDDRLCGCLLSVASSCDENDTDKVLECLQQANPKLVTFVSIMEDSQTSFDSFKEEFRTLIGETAVEARRPFCNCLIDICRKRNLQERAHELLYLGTVYGLYPGLHNRTSVEWCLDVRSLSVGAAHTALEEWMGTLSKAVERKEALPELFTAQTGAGTHRFSQGLSGAFASHLNKLAAPFKLSEDRAGFFVASREDIVSWVQKSSTPHLSPSRVVT